jgi:DJ-1/PfpI family
VWICDGQRQSTMTSCGGNTNNPSFFAKPAAGGRDPRLPCGAAAGCCRPAAGLHLRQRARREGRRGTPHAPRVVSAGAPVVTASAGLGLVAEPLPRARAALDTLLVAGGPGVHAAAADPVVLDWLRVRATGARRIASACTGAFLLAATGLLDGRRAATHWMHVPNSPGAFRPFGLSRTRSTCATVRFGLRRVTAAIDLALALVEEDVGRSLALAVARHLVIFLKRPGGQAQFNTALSLQGAKDRFGALHSWMAGRLTDDLSLPALAWDERAQLYPPLYRGNRDHPGTRCRAAARRNGAAPSFRYAPAGQAHRCTLRLRIGRNTAPKLFAPAGCDTAALQSEIQRLSPLRVSQRRSYRRRHARHDPMDLAADVHPYPQQSSSAS